MTGLSWVIGSKAIESGGVGSSIWSKIPTQFHLCFRCIRHVLKKFVKIANCKRCLFSIMALQWNIHCLQQVVHTFLYCASHQKSMNCCRPTNRKQDVTTEYQQWCRTCEIWPSEVLVLVLDSQVLVLEAKSLHLLSAPPALSAPPVEGVFCFLSLASLWGHIVRKWETVWWGTLLDDNVHSRAPSSYCHCTASRLFTVRLQPPEACVSILMA